MSAARQVADANRPWHGADCSLTNALPINHRGECTPYYPDFPCIAECLISMKCDSKFNRCVKCNEQGTIVTLFSPNYYFHMKLHYVVKSMFSLVTGKTRRKLLLRLGFRVGKKYR